jgi:DNA-binding transcriptional MerR regulator
MSAEQVKVQVGHDDLRVEAAISYRQLDHWIRSGLVPGVDCPGSGHRREFTYEGRQRVLTLARLTRAGFSLSRAAKAARQLEQNGWADLGGGLVLHMHDEKT